MSTKLLPVLPLSDARGRLRHFPDRSGLDRDVSGERRGLAESNPSVDDEHVATGVALHHGGDVRAQEPAEHAVVMSAEHDQPRPRSFAAPTMALAGSPAPQT